MVVRDGSGDDDVGRCLAGPELWPSGWDHATAC